MKEPLLPFYGSKHEPPTAVSMVSALGAPTAMSMVSGLGAPTVVSMESGLGAPTAVSIVSGLGVFTSQKLSVQKSFSWTDARLGGSVYACHQA